MRKNQILWFWALLVFASCSTEVDLYAPYEQKPIVYGILDANADTNFIKIVRTFSVQGDAYQTAQDPDSSNYPGKLDVRLVEYCNRDSIREIVLDTITIHDKESGIFYAPDQKLYYTAEPLHQNTKTEQYSYKLKVVFPDRTLTTKTDIVGNAGFDIQSLAVDFSKEYIGAVPRQFLFHPAIKGAVYEFRFSFTFLEQRGPDGDSVPRTMTWKAGTFSDEYFALNTINDAYVFSYYPSPFYDRLKEFVGDDSTLLDVQRFITDYPVEITIIAGEEKLSQYIHNNNSDEGFLAGDSEFSLINGGYGVFSSRMTLCRKVRLGGNTVPDLLNMTGWNFKFIGGK